MEGTVNYTVAEGLKAGALLLSKLAEAAKEGTDGGTTITKAEAVEITIQVLTQVGMDVIDEDGE